MATEPHSSNVAAFLVAAVGPMTGDYSVIVFAALAGGLWPLAGAETKTRSEGAYLLLRLVTMAAVFAGTAALVLESQFHIPATKALAPVAFLIAALGDRWQAIFAALGDGLARFFSSLGGRQ